MARMGADKPRNSGRTTPIIQISQILTRRREGPNQGRKAMRCTGARLCDSYRRLPIRTTGDNSLHGGSVKVFRGRGEQVGNLGRQAGRRRHKARGYDTRFRGEPAGGFFGAGLGEGGRHANYGVHGGSRTQERDHRQSGDEGYGAKPAKLYQSSKPFRF